MIDVGIFFKHSWKLGYANLNLDILQSQMHPNEMLLISHPGQVCLVRPGWYERCVAFVQQASHRAALLCPRLIVIQREGHDR